MRLLFILAFAFLCIRADLELVQDLNPFGGIASYVKVFASQDGTQFLLDRTDENLAHLYQVNATSSTLTLIYSSTNSPAQSGFTCQGSAIMYPQGLQYVYATGIFRNLTVGTEMLGCTPNDELITFIVDSFDGVCIAVQLANGTRSSPICLEGLSRYSGGYQLNTFTTAHRVYLQFYPYSASEFGYVISYDDENGLIAYLAPTQTPFMTTYKEPRLYVLTYDSLMMIDETSSNFTSVKLPDQRNHALMGVWQDEVYLGSCYWQTGCRIYARYANSSDYDRTILTGGTDLFVIRDPLSRGFYSTFDGVFGFYNFSTNALFPINTSEPITFNFASSITAVQDGFYLQGDNLTFYDVYSGEMEVVFADVVEAVINVNSDIYAVTYGNGCPGSLYKKEGTTWQEYKVGGHWQSSSSSDNSVMTVFNSTAIFFGKATCGNWSLWATDGLDITWLTEIGHYLPEGSLFCDSNPTDNYIYVTRAPGLIRTDGTPQGTRYFSPSFDTIQCGYEINGSYYYFDGQTAMKISENGNVSEIGNFLPYDQTPTAHVSVGNSMYFIFEGNTIIFFDGNVLKNLTAPENLGKTFAVFNGGLYFTDVVESTTFLYFYDSQQNLNVAGNFSDSDSQNAGTWTVNNTLFVTNGVDLYMSTDGLHFEEFARYMTKSVPILFYNNTLYFNANGEAASLSRGQEYGRYLSLNEPQVYENTIWGLDDTEWTSLDVITGKRTTHVVLNDNGFIPVLLGNGYSVLISGGDDYGTEPRRIPGPGTIPIPSSSEKTSSSSDSSSSNGPSSSRSSTSNQTMSSISSTQKEGPTISTQDENSGSIFCLPILISITIPFVI
eukprot:TRINITY_DN2277_c1_g1_i1.p1 TRINITY_DN2277_c1_g1~~TRINITY_DN2277_c1_g1_i1.p1  ORF type:complete len:833 (-),score=164.28 TRINITY_DN2277_c1_g1_i1:132-2630(-)